MKIFNYLSFLKNKNSKVKLSFCAIIFLAVLIVFADALSIITLLPLVSLISESNVDFQNNIYLNYLPFFLVDYLSKIDIWAIFTILLLTLLFRNVIHLLNDHY